MASNTEINLQLPQPMYYDINGNRRKVSNPLPEQIELYDKNGKIFAIITTCPKNLDTAKEIKEFIKNEYERIHSDKIEAQRLRKEENDKLKKQIDEDNILVNNGIEELTKLTKDLDDKIINIQNLADNERENNKQNGCIIM